MDIGQYFEDEKGNYLGQYLSIEYPAPERDSICFKASPETRGQLSATLKWLLDTYECADGICLPRCELYAHYQDFCQRREFKSISAASFGKLIRQQFPKLKTRRLGTRGQSKYHYYGIGIKETSIYYQSVYSGCGLTRFSGTKVKTEGTCRKYSLSSKIGTLLPDFPDAESLILSDELRHEEVNTFLLMYQLHCQRILDTVIAASFDEVPGLLLHFWQGLPRHLHWLLREELIVDTVGFYDSILYKAFIDVLIPSSMMDIPEGLSAELMSFTKQLPGWLAHSLEGISPGIRSKKTQVARTMLGLIKRQISFLYIAQIARSVLSDQNHVACMTQDLLALDLNIAFNQLHMAAGPRDSFALDKSSVLKGVKEFQLLLQKPASIEIFMNWLDSIVEKYVSKYRKVRKPPLQDCARVLTLHWNFLSSKILHELTLRQARSCGSFIVIHTLCEEYLNLILGTLAVQQTEEELLRAFHTHSKNPGMEFRQTSGSTHSLQGLSALSRPGSDIEPVTCASALRAPRKDTPWSGGAAGGPAMQMDAHFTATSVCRGSNSGSPTSLPTDAPGASKGFSPSPPVEPNLPSWNKEYHPSGGLESFWDPQRAGFTHPVHQGSLLCMGKEDQRSSSYTHSRSGFKCDFTPNLYQGELCSQDQGIPPDDMFP